MLLLRAACVAFGRAPSAAATEQLVEHAAAVQGVLSTGWSHVDACSETRCWCQSYWRDMQLRVVFMSVGEVLVASTKRMVMDV
jgi:hypothetical protein